MKKNNHSTVSGGTAVPDRLLRVNELIKRELAVAVESLVLPENNLLLSIVEVRASEDLRTATVFASIYGGTPEGRRKSFGLLLKNRISLQEVLARRLAFKHTPVLNFINDESGMKADRVWDILRKHEEQKEK